VRALLAAGDQWNVGFLGRGQVRLRLKRKVVRPQREGTAVRHQVALVLLGLAPLTWPTIVCGQEATARSASIVGRVRDASTQPVLRARVCAFGETPRAIQCAVADTAGRFRLDSLYPGLQTLQAECETGRRTFDMQTLTSERIVARAHETVTADFAVSAAGCDQRPYKIIRGELTGHWEFGFELDDFVPCQDSTKHAWVERRSLRPGEEWPLPAGESVEGGYRWFVRWRGVLVGPRSLLKPYHMVVDDVLEMRPPSRSDCKT
jgi:hypothetical protein